MVHAKKFVLT